MIADRKCKHCENLFIVNGRKTLCEDCRENYNTNYYQKHRERILEKTRNRHIKNRLPPKILTKTCRYCRNNFETTKHNKFYCSDPCIRSGARRRYFNEIKKTPKSK